MMHCYWDREAPLRAGRELFGRTLDQAIEHAAELWDEGTYAAACGYVIMDTEEGEVVATLERDQRALSPRGPVATGRMAPALALRRKLIARGAA